MQTETTDLGLYRKAFGLTPAQTHVLRLITHGKRNREIAVCLSISARTVEKHVEKILVAMGAENRTSAAAIALEHLNHASRPQP